jgi:hypothetical protein
MHGVGQNPSTRDGPYQESRIAKEEEGMNPHTEMKHVGSPSQARRHRKPFFGKSHIALAMALLASLAASAPAQSEESGEPHHIIVPVRTRVIGADPKGSCNQYSVEVNGVKYNCGDGSLSGVNIVSFYRQPAMRNGWPTLGLYEYRAIHTDQGTGFQPVKDYLDHLLNDSEVSKDLLVIVSTFGQVGGHTWEIAPELEKFGATTEFRNIGYPEFAFSFIGIKGTKKGQAYQVGGDGVFKNPHDSWSLNGYFAPDSQGKYAFFQPDYVQFELMPGNGMIKVGGREYPASSGAKDGLHVLAVNRATLVPLPGYPTDRVYPLDSLPAFPNDESYLYFITSVGNAFPKDLSRAQQLGAATMERLGGTYDLFADAGFSDRYSLVGAVNSALDLQPYAAAESGSLLPGQPTGDIRGVLQRQRRGNFFSPVESDLTGVANLDFFSILNQRPVPFKFPHQDNDAEQEAFRISMKGSVSRRGAMSETAIGIPISIFQVGNPHWNHSTGIRRIHRWIVTHPICRKLPTV